MKKILGIFLALLFITACNKDNNDSKPVPGDCVSLGNINKKTQCPPDIEIQRKILIEKAEKNYEKLLKDLYEQTGLTPKIEKKDGKMVITLEPDMNKIFEIQDKKNKQVNNFEEDLKVLDNHLIHPLTVTHLVGKYFDDKKKIDKIFKRYYGIK